MLKSTTQSMNETEAIKDTARRKLMWADHAKRKLVSLSLDRQVIKKASIEKDCVRGLS